MLLYSALLTTVLVVGAPLWLLRLLTSGRYRAGLAERLGRVPRGLGAAVAAPEPSMARRKVAWVHAVSVGEVLAAAELVRELQRVRPEWAVVISTTTEAGQRLARERFRGLPVFYLPLDFAVLVRRYLRVLRPRLLVLMESELWPNLLRESRRARCEIVVANARISDRSFPRYMRLRRLWRPILGQVSMFLAQGEETAGRLRAIGVPAERVVVTGNLKYDRSEALAGGSRGVLFERLQAGLPAGARLLVAGSTLAGEEERLLGVWGEVVRAVPEAVLLLAPRHTDRFGAVAEMVRRHGFALRRMSGAGPEERFRAGEVLLLDTIGDLAGVYELASVAFIGGSLVAAGGHNPLEPARFGVPVVMGPSIDNFREVVRAMRAEEAICVLAPGAEVGAALATLLRGGEGVAAMGRRGEAVQRAQAGAAARAVRQMLELPVLRTGGAGQDGSARRDGREGQTGRRP